MPSVAVEQPASKPRVSILDIEKVRVVKRLLWVESAPYYLTRNPKLNDVSRNEHRCSKKCTYTSPGSLLKACGVASAVA
jgi:hypothetical protein